MRLYGYHIPALHFWWQQSHSCLLVYAFFYDIRKASCLMRVPYGVTRNVIYTSGAALWFGVLKSSLLTHLQAACMTTARRWWVGQGAMVILVGAGVILFVVIVIVG